MDANNVQLNAVELFQKLMRENNLTYQFTKPQIKHIDDGGILIEAPQLLIGSTIENTTTLPNTPEQEAPDEPNPENQTSRGEEVKEDGTQTPQ